ncbi:hypothetical protein GUJ93_ZPchr0012g20918 [Zizania palustris]|uniref:Uncharacterized protein n=1 Tax=Zizania palustris TaxID=103762 RepID=A0A8J5WRX1_ZIZPA|nr:hypothetical protein GUJ93_ZPchr0012g20918 [Zizania palustris]
MVRWQPPLPPDGEHSFGHETIALAFVVACVAATVALVSSMCSACGRKPKKEAGAGAGADDATATGSVSDVSVEIQTGDDDEEKPVVTLSPELATHGPIAPVALPKTTSKRRLSMSMSVNIPDKMRLQSRRERRDKVEPEDTLWKKAIILGEKCKIPGEREGECEADELPAGSFRRSSYSRPMSRSISLAVHQPHDAPAAASHS